MKTYYIIYHANRNMYTRGDELIFDDACESRAEADARVKELRHENPDTDYHITEGFGELGKTNSKRYFKVMTNADHIRSMADEELAYVLAGQCSCCAYQPQISDCAGGSCQEGVLEWLKQEAENG